MTKAWLAQLQCDGVIGAVQANLEQIVWQVGYTKAQTVFVVVCVFSLTLTSIEENGKF